MESFQNAGVFSQLKQEVKALLLDTKLNLLLVLIPFAFGSYYGGWSDGATFVLSLLALCPLAERLGFITEQLAMYTNDTLGESQPHREDHDFLCRLFLD